MKKLFSIILGLTIVCLLFLFIPTKTVLAQSFNDESAACKTVSCIQGLYEKYNVPSSQRLDENKIQNNLDQGWQIKTYQTSLTPEQIQNNLNSGTVLSSETKLTEGQQKQNEANKQRQESHWFLDELKEWGNMILGGIGKTVAVVIATIIEWIVLPIATIVTAISGILLDAALNLSLNNSNLRVVMNEMVLPAWVIIRNLLNITFIFILLWDAIKMIIGAGSSETKKIISGVIITAILINFSLVATKIAIDAGNYVATALVNQIDSQENNPNLKIIKEDKISLSAPLIENLKIQNAWSPADTNKSWENSPTVGSVDQFFQSFLKLVLAVVTAIAFFIAAMLLIARCVALVFLIATSPIGFMGDLIPMLKEYSQEWRKSLYGQIMVAPVFLFFMFLTMQMLKSNLAFSASALVEKPFGTDIGLYLQYILGITMMMMSVKITKSYSGKIGAAFEKTGSWLASTTIGAVTGGVASSISFAGRRSIGAAAAKLASSDSMKQAAASGGLRGFIGNRAIAGLNKASSSSFDIRNTQSFGNMMKSLEKETGVSINSGKGNKGGYTGMNKEYAERQEKFAKDNLARNLTDEQAEREHRTEIINKRSEMNKNRQRINAINNEMQNQSLPDDIKRRYERERDELARTIEKQRKEFTALKTEGRVAWTKNENGEYNSSEEAKKAREKIKRNRNQLYQQRYSEAEGSSLINRVLGRAKVTKEKIDKGVLKGKSGAEQIQEIIEREAKEKEKREGGATTTVEPTTSSGGPTVPPTTT